VRPLFGQVVFRETRINGTSLDAGVAVDALFGVDVQLLSRAEPGLIRRWVDAIHGADLAARVVLDADTRLGNHIRHSGRVSSGQLERHVQ
jgi:hypothetical protein